MNLLPPAVRRTVRLQIGVAVLMGLVAGPLTFDLLTNPRTRSRPDFEPFCWAMAVIGYWSVAAALSAVLIRKRKRAGLYLAWTVLPGILRTAPGLLSQEMQDYLDGQT
jgi:hypothetical protein